MSNEPQLHATPSQHHRFHVLDALRGVAAILVVLWHTPGYLFGRGSRSSFLAVDFFFCLSGFVIAFSYERRIETILRVRDFMVARLIRFYPSYFVGILLGAIVMMLPLLYHHTHIELAHRMAMILPQMIMVPNYHIWKSNKLYPLDGSAWSLFFEVVANFAYALLLRRRLANNWVLISLIFVSLITILRAVSNGSGIDLGWSSSQFYLGLARVGLSFLLGVLVLRFFRLHSSFDLPRRWRRATALLVTLLLIGILLSPIGMLRKEDIQLLEIVFVFPILVYFGALAEVPRSLSRFCAYLGDISYPIYVLHPPLLAILAIVPIVSFALKHPAARPSLLFLWLVLVIAFSHFIFKQIDEPARKLLRLAYNRPHRVAVVPSVSHFGDTASR